MAASIRRGRQDWFCLELAGACGKHRRKLRKDPWRRNRASRYNRRLQIEARLKVRVSLVNTPVTVRDGKGQMIHDLDAKNFTVTDNGISAKDYALRFGRRSDFGGDFDGDEFAD